MLILELTNVKKYFGHRLILSVDSLKLYTGDKIGVVGLNGAGKTTLLRILSGELQPEEGEIKRSGSLELISQLDGEDQDQNKSGGEKTLERISRALSGNSHLLLADEPTSNLSLSHIEQLKDNLAAFQGCMLLISHHKDLLNSLCNKIIEIEDGKIFQYTGDYDFYLQAKKLKDEQHRQHYESYVKERNRLTESVTKIKRKAASMKEAPKRMGNSEARLVKGAIRQRAGKVAGSAAGIEARLEKLEKVDRPVEQKRTAITISEGSRLYSKVAIEASGLTKAFGNRILFSGASFKITNGSKTALIGENGTGKTTLLKMLMEGGEGIRRAPALKTAYFSQDLSILDESKTIYQNVAEESAMSQTEIRGILSRMLFFREDVFKLVSVLSGGERVKVALCKIFCRDVNMLILDEPNNYLDVYGMEALLGMIEDYTGTILFVSHDKVMLDLADHLLIAEKGRIQAWTGQYAEYIESKAAKPEPLDANLRLQIQNRLAFLIGEISAASMKGEDVTKLDEEFMELSKRIRG